MNPYIKDYHSPVEYKTSTVNRFYAGTTVSDDDTLTCNVSTKSIRPYGCTYYVSKFLYFGGCVLVVSRNGPLIENYTRLLTFGDLLTVLLTTEENEFYGIFYSKSDFDVPDIQGDYIRVGNNINDYYFDVDERKVRNFAKFDHVYFKHVHHNGNRMCFKLGDDTYILNVYRGFYKINQHGATKNFMLDSLYVDNLKITTILDDCRTVNLTVVGALQIITKLPISIIYQSAAWV